jgi:hypothetical protein
VPVVILAELLRIVTYARPVINHRMSARGSVEDVRHRYDRGRPRRPVLPGRRVGLAFGLAGVWGRVTVELAPVLRRSATSGRAGERPGGASSVCCGLDHQARRPRHEANRRVPAAARARSGAAAAQP